MMGLEAVPSLFFRLALFFPYALVFFKTPFFVCQPLFHVGRAFFILIFFAPSFCPCFFPGALHFCFVFRERPPSFLPTFLGKSALLLCQAKERILVRLRAEDEESFETEAVLIFAKKVTKTRCVAKLNPQTNPTNFARQVF